MGPPYATTRPWMRDNARGLSARRAARPNAETQGRARRVRAFCARCGGPGRTRGVWGGREAAGAKPPVSERERERSGRSLIT